MFGSSSLFHAGGQKWILFYENYIEITVSDHLSFISGTCLIFLFPLFQGEKRVFFLVSPIHSKPFSGTVQPFEVSSAHQFIAATVQRQTRMSEPPRFHICLELYSSLPETSPLNVFSTSGIRFEINLTVSISPARLPAFVWPERAV